MTPLQAKAAHLRRVIFEAAVRAGTGHIPGAFSWVEIAVALFYGNVMNFRAQEPKWNARDRFILSKGHACLTMYAALADLGFFSPEELNDFCKPGAMLHGHPDHNTPGVEVTTGSLGHGLGIAAGMALSAKIAGACWRTFVVMGDGECAEGSVWEAASFAAEHELCDLVAIIDKNGLGATGRTGDTSLAVKFSSFGWDTMSIPGHDIGVIVATLIDHFRNGTRPLAIIAHTTKGKGVGFMENSEHWHHQMPKGDLAKEARRLLA